MSVRIGHRFGLISLLCGVSACFVFLSVAHVGRLRELVVGGYLLGALDWLGLVREERTYLVEMKPSSIFSLNDSNAFVWMTFLACLLACAAATLALVAEYKRESTLYLSAGFIVATAGAGLISPLGMVIAQALGVLAIIEIRRRHAVAI